MAAKNQTKVTEGEIPFHLDTKFTVAEAAKELKRSTRTIRDWIKERKLGAYRIGHVLIITGSQMDAFARERVLKYVLFGDTADAAELDPAYEPPTINEVDLDSLNDEELNAAILYLPKPLKTTANRKQSVSDTDTFTKDENPKGELWTEEFVKKLLGESEE